MNHDIVAELREHAPIVFWRFALMAMMAAGLTASVQFAFYNIMPAKYWFEYESVRPVQPVRAGRRLDLVSTAAIYRRVDMRWNDVLRCRFGDGRGFRIVSTVATSDDDVEPRPMGEKVWTYGRHAPVAGAQCYIRSVITVRLPYGAEKSQVITGDFFTVQQ